MGGNDLKTKQDRERTEVGLILLYTARARTSPATCGPENGVTPDVRDVGWQVSRDTHLRHRTAKVDVREASAPGLEGRKREGGLSLRGDSAVGEKEKADASAKRADAVTWPQTVDSEVRSQHASPYRSLPTV